MGPGLATGLARFLLPVVLYTVARRVHVGARDEPWEGFANDPSCGLQSSKIFCGQNECCSGAGYCGTTPEYCEGSQCQIEFSDNCDTFFGPDGPDTHFVPRPKIGDVPYGTEIWRCSKPGTMALTFDDGPWKFTSQILDILDSLDAKATFFISGNNLGKGHIDDPSTIWPAVLHRMYDAGHQIGSHTWTHRDLNKVLRIYQRDKRRFGYRVRKTEIIFNEMAFRNLFGWIPTYIRPPYLECARSCMEFLDRWGYHVISTTVDTKDYKYDDPSRIYKSRKKFDRAVSLKPSENGLIVLAHDVHYQTVVNLTAYMVNSAREHGYRLVTVGECLGDPKENWYRAAHVGRQTESPPSPTPVPKTPSSLVPSPNQHCGGNSGFTCQGSKFGECCSFFGYCGSSPEYCGTGCDITSGICESVGQGMLNSTNGLCGPTFEATCLYDKNKPCCSRYGYCGSDIQHCGEGCQTKYGKC